MNALADVDYHDWPRLEKYIDIPLHHFTQNVRTLLVHVARGCNWKCSFCINTYYARHKAFHRCKSIEKIRRETETVIREFDVKCLIAQDEDFFADSTLVEDWSAFAKDMGCLWMANGRFNYFRSKIDPPFLSRLLESGLIQLGMSVEAGCEKLRNEVIHKQIRNADIQKAIEIIRNTPGAERLFVNVSFVINFPGDNLENRIQTVKMMFNLSNNMNVIFSGPQSYRDYPGTELSLKHSDWERGVLDVYLDNMSVDGALKPRDFNSWTTRFYEYPLPIYLNNRCAKYVIRDSDARPLEFISHPRKNSLQLRLLGLWMLPIRLRRFIDCWAFFVDPPVIYGLFLLQKKIRVWYYDTLGKARRAPRKFLRIIKGWVGRGGD
jgi:radical SAM superfamily enzyme YgiQ (UPF0313 family)